MKVKEQNAYLSIATFLQMIILTLGSYAVTESLTKNRSDLFTMVSIAICIALALVLSTIYLKFLKTNKKKKS